MINKPLVIAEIGCNHQGNINLAKEMIQAASNCGAEYVKFQKRENKILLGEDYFKPHPVPHNSFGKNYGEHREKLEFNIKQHEMLYKFCLKKNIKYSISVWDKISAEKILNSKINLDYIKIPSACNQDYELIDFLLKKFKKKIHISLGMTTLKEEQKLVNFIKKKKKLKNVVLYSCTSDYPVKFEDICISDINRLKKKYNLPIGFSGHHLGIAIDMAAVAFGAKFIERHFTLDRTLKGTDHAASLEPNGLKKLTRDITNLTKALKIKNGLLPTEKKQRLKLKKNVIN